MSRASKDRASKLREYHDRLQEWHETRSKKAAREIISAMRRYDLKTFERATEHSQGELESERAEREELLRKIPVRVTKKESNNGID